MTSAEHGPESRAEPVTARIPGATYRLQLSAELTFAGAEGLVPYLDALGITDLYTSSYLTAQAGSRHGYDIVDHHALNPEIGTPETHRRMAEALRARAMGHLLDVVPNHMGIARSANAWWNDVLENGPSSPHAEVFDIDWEPVERHLANKVLLPILGDQFGRVLERQELALGIDEGRFRLRYYETVLPIEPRSATQVLAHALPALAAGLFEGDADLAEYQSIITALSNLPAVTERAPERVRERLREKEVVRRRLARLVETVEPVRAALAAAVDAFNGKAGDPRSFDLLERLIDEQPYRLAHWRVAGEEINYRRFFDVNELAAIRMESSAVFQETHRLVLELVEAGLVTGLRIDHPDGLYDPRRYFLALQRERFAQVVRAELAAGGGPPPDRLDDDTARAARAFEGQCEPAPMRPGCRPLYVIAEKILGRGERLPAQWAIHGTTGYEIMSALDGLQVDSANARAMTSAYVGFTAQRTPFADLVYQSKQLIMEVSMSSELTVLGHALSRLAQRNRYARDFTRTSLTSALREVIACFPLYRTYVDGESEVTLQDRACVEVAVAFAKRRNPATSVSIFDFVRDVLLLRDPEQVDPAYRRDLVAFVRKLQQVTSPVTAKGVEDTAFYRYHRLVSLNEVGGDPDRFGVSVADFHAQMAARQEAWPGALTAISTHDTKRSADVRARINVLSEMPRAWREAVRRWHAWNRRHGREIDGRRVPDRNDEYLLYQTLVGAWPLGELDDAGRADFTARIQAYMAKATREAKVHTSWVNPDAAYDEALHEFVARLLDPAVAGRFLVDLAAFQAPIARLGMVNSLAQVLLTVTVPGVPDFYQGTELWDLSLVDPDNRRPVDFAARVAALEALRARGDATQLAALASELLREWTDGRIKLHVAHRALACRRDSAALFRDGAYLPLETTGRHAAHLCAFARHAGERAVVVVVPRLVARLTDGGARPPLGEATWGDTRVRLPAELAAGDYADVLTGLPAKAVAEREGAGAAFEVGALLDVLPVALIERRTP